jgi:Carboxypeptidase regulatory-like domain/TonB dependent receptor
MEPSPRGRSLASLAFLAVTLVCLAAGGHLEAQGLTGAALQGRILGPDSAAVEDARVSVLNQSNGERWQTSSRTRGRYEFERLSVGGPYLIEVRAVGYAPARQADIYLALGQRLAVDFSLARAAYELDAITVTSEPDPRLNAGRTGPAQSIDQGTISRLPVPGRDFKQLALLSPHVVATPTEGLSIDGQPDRLNAIQIDGTTATDLMGSSGIAGIQVLGNRLVSVESIKELQVISAPFDVRFGNFAAGLINAVTRSGTNRLEGSLSTYYSGRSLVGKDSQGFRGNDFENKELSATLGGPIIRDRLSFFLDGGIQRRVTPETAPLITPSTTAADTNVRVSYDAARRFRAILRDRYGVDAGDSGPYPLRIPAENLFAKLTLQLGLNSRLEVSNDFSSAHLSLIPDRGGFYSLASSAFSLPASINATRLTWTAGFGRRVTNELIAARLRQHFRCVSNSEFPVVQASVGERLLAAGSNCPQGVIRNRVTEDQRALELTDNITLVAGAHRLTFGTHDELIQIRSLPPLDYFYITQWQFQSLDSLEAGTPFSYLATLRDSLRPSGPLSSPDVRQVGVYAQDQWSPSNRWTLTAGLRIDVPFLSREPVLNPGLLAGPLGLDNTRTPSGKALWSPRLGANIDVKGDGSTYVRGGIGLFAGRPAYKWFVAVDAHTGRDVVYLDCEGQGVVPPFTLDPNAQPRTCGPGPQGPTGPLVNAFDPGFRFPRNLKLALGMDHKFRSGWVGTLDFLYTGGVDQYDLVDVNLREPTVATGEGGRPMYGTIDETGTPSPARRDAGFGPVIMTRNSRGNRAYALTAQLQKHFANGTELGASYTYSRSRDRLSPGLDNTDGDVNFTLLDGTLDHRNLRTALWEVPHRFTVLATANLPGAVQFSLFYEGRSGSPFTYGIEGDANADGFGDDDIAYVPTDVRPGGDIALVVLDTVSGLDVAAPQAVYDSVAQFIRDRRCLRNQRGHLMRRNSCRLRWTSGTQARLAKVVPTFGGHTLELSLDVFNLLHLLDDDWGLVRGADDRLFGLAGYDSPNARGIYTWLAPHREFVDDGASRWSMQLGARWRF